MDQVYIPKHRSGFSIGSYVVLKPLEKESAVEKPYFYNIGCIEPVKLHIITEIIKIIDKNYQNYENIIFAGSFLERGFNFNDVDLLLVSNTKQDVKYIKNIIEKNIGIKAHIILIDIKSLLEGLATDPLYQMMLSKCISKKRFIFNVKRKVLYKILDLQLLKSKILINNFDILNGVEKYYLTRNIIALYLYILNKKLSKEIVDKEIKKIFEISVKLIKQNMLNKKSFLNKYKKIYKKTFDKIMDSIQSDSK